MSNASYRLTIACNANKFNAYGSLSETYLPFNTTSANHLDKVSRVAKHQSAFDAIVKAASAYLETNHEVLPASEVLDLEIAFARLNIDLPQGYQR